MRVFVTGASGYIGSAVVRALRGAGHEVWGLVRAEEKAKDLMGPGFTPVIGDIEDSTSYLQESNDSDAIIHTAFVPTMNAGQIDKDAVSMMLQTAGSPNASVFVYTSGIWVLGETGDKAADETAPTSKPAPVVAWRPAVEQKVLSWNKKGLYTAVVRPGIVYGGQGGLLSGFFNAVESGQPVRHIGDGNNRWPAIHVEDLADLYVRIVEKAGTPALQGLSPAERVFHGTDGSTDRLKDIATAASQVKGGPANTAIWPITEARKTFGPMADAMAMDQIVTSPRSERLLDWHPRRRGFVASAAEAYREWKQGSGQS